MSDMSHCNVPDCTNVSEYKGLRLEQYYTINIFSKNMYMFLYMNRKIEQNLFQEHFFCILIHTFKSHF